MEFHRSLSENAFFPKINSQGADWVSVTRVNFENSAISKEVDGGGPYQRGGGGGGGGGEEDFEVLTTILEREGVKIWNDGM